MTQEIPPHPWWKNEYLLLLLILVIGAALRIARSGYDVLSFDEQWHIELSTGRGSIHATVPRDVVVDSAPPTGTLRGAPPWYRVWSTLGEAVHPPLYFITLRLWREMMGEGEAAARALSILFSLLSIPVIYEVGRRSVGVWPALGAALLFAVAPTQVYIAQQVRGYAMLQFVGTAALLSVVLVERSNRPRPGYSVLLGISVLAMMLTHYFAIGGAVAIGLYVLWRLHAQARWQTVAALIISAGIYAVIWLPWARPQLSYAGSASSWLADNRGAVARAATIARTITVPWRQISTDRPTYTSRTPHFTQPWAYVSGIIFVLPPLLMRRKPGMLVWYLWLMGTIGFLTTLDLARSTTHLRFTRYIVIAAPAVFMLTTSLLEIAAPWLGRGVFAVLVVAAVGLNPHMYQNEEPDWSRIGAILNQHARPGEALVVYHGTVSDPAFSGLYYLAAALYSDVFPRPLVRLSKPADQALVEQLPGETAWLITTPVAPRPEEVLPSTTIIEQYDVPQLVTCARVRLPQRTPTTAPLQTGLSAP